VGMAARFAHRWPPHRSGVTGPTAQQCTAADHLRCSSPAGWRRHTDGRTYAHQHRSQCASARMRRGCVQGTGRRVGRPRRGGGSRARQPRQRPRSGTRQGGAPEERVGVHVPRDAVAENVARDLATVEVLVVGRLLARVVDNLRPKRAGWALATPARLGGEHGRARCAGMRRAVAAQPGADSAHTKPGETRACLASASMPETAMPMHLSTV
jgi:hypothetical protein